ncbi:MAG: pilus assembly protein [Burkholderiaceae bacterium]|nr:pilus assembly protein [Burkholderiaceae bacterium]
MKTNRHTSHHRRASRQQGASLVVSLLMLVAVLLLGISAAQIALQGEKASRGDRDRQIAFQAAEAALADAEIDIEKSSASNSRSSVFKEKDVLDHYFITGCGTTGDNGGKSLGLCQPAPAGQTPVWLTVDFTDTGASTAKSVAYGAFTGQEMQVGTGSTPARLPRYIIEIFKYNQAGSGTGGQDSTFFFRITAIGYGMRDTTKVVLQTFYRKIEKT